MPTIDATTENAAPNDPVIVNAPGTWTFNGAVTKNYHGLVITNAAAGAIIDGAGYTLTYDNKAANADVLNGDFETDALEATTITGWTFTGAGTSQIIKARDTLNMLGGTKVLRIGPTTDQHIMTSAAITITDTTIYHAVWFRWGRLPASDLAITLEILDANDSDNPLDLTGAGSYAAPASTIERGQFDPVLFIPGTSSIKIRITITPTTSTTVDIDDVTIRRSLIAGVVGGFESPSQLTAIGGSPADYFTSTSGSFPNWPAFGATAQAAWSARGAISYTVKNLLITQGANTSIGNYGLFGTLSNGVTIGGAGVGNVFTMGGIDPQPIWLGQHGGGGTGEQPLVIVDNTFTLTGSEAISHRFRDFAVVRVAPKSGSTSESWTVTGNTITDCPASGISCAGISDSGLATITDNAVGVESLAANSYGISASGSCLVDTNTITGRGRGIIIGVGNGGSYSGFDVTNNTITLGDRFNREYPSNGQSPIRGIRARNTTDAHGDILGVNISGNTVTVTSGADAESPTACIALRISLRNDTAGMDDAGFVISNNTLKAIATGAGDTGKCLEFTGVEPGINVTGGGNTYESNYLGIQICDGEAPVATDDITLTNNIFVDSASGYDFGGLTCISFGVAGRTFNEVYLLKNTVPAAATHFVFGDATGTRVCYVSEVVTINVTDSVDAAINGASVSLAAGTLSASQAGFSNASGQVFPTLVTHKYVDEALDTAEGGIQATVAKSGKVTVKAPIQPATIPNPVFKLQDAN